VYFSDLYHLLVLILFLELLVDSFQAVVVQVSLGTKKLSRQANYKFLVKIGGCFSSLLL
jgi:hypothetical protein